VAIHILLASNQPAHRVVLPITPLTCIGVLLLTPGVLLLTPGVHLLTPRTHLDSLLGSRTNVRPNISRQPKRVINARRYLQVLRLLLRHLDVPKTAPLLLMHKLQPDLHSITCNG
jgi:hypothetical protein